MTVKLAYTIPEAVDATGLGERQIRDAIRAGRLRTKRTGTDKDGEPAGKHVILHSALEAFLEGLADG